jgi:Mrp family chromosome partitioning ATPase
MSRIYEALRQHRQQPGNGVASSPSSPDLDDFSLVDRDMQNLYRSVEAAISGRNGGVVIMFSSAHPSEGKTTVCGAFATTLARYFGLSVLILDGDHDHALTRRFGARDDATLSVLEKSPETVLRNGKRYGTRGSIAVVPIASFVGSADAESPERDLIATIKEKLIGNFDFVLIDAPSIASVSWSPYIARMTDGVIIIIEAENTRWPVVMNAKIEFENSGAKVLGAFLNKRRFYIPPRIYPHL